MSTKQSIPRKRALFLEMEKLARELEGQQRAWRTSRQVEEESVSRLEQMHAGAEEANRDT